MPETPTMEEAIEETRELISDMAEAIRSVKGTSEEINAQDIPNEIRDILSESHVVKTYYDVRTYLNDIATLLKPYVSFSLDTSRLNGSSGWLVYVPRFGGDSHYTYKTDNHYSSNFSNKGKTYTSEALSIITEKCSNLAMEDYDHSKGYLTILEYQELWNPSTMRPTGNCLYLYKQVYTITESGGRTYYALESDTNVARLDVSTSGNNLNISSIITDNIPQRADIDDKCTRFSKHNTK